ncbi:MAG: DUF819 domain-containing protein [Pyramidobacter sp.]
METLIGADNSQALWAVLACIAAGSIWLEQKTETGRRLTSVVLALLGTMLLSNAGIIPVSAPAYDAVWNYAVPPAVVLLLFDCNIRRIRRETGRLLAIYLLSAAGTAAGALAGFALLGKYVPEARAFAAMFTGTYIGGSVNFIAMADLFLSDKSLVSAGVVADNLLMALYFFALIAVPRIAWFRRNYRSPRAGQPEMGHGAENPAQDYWKPRPVSLLSIAFDIAAALAIAALSAGAASFFRRAVPRHGVLLTVLSGLLGSQYLEITTITAALATFFPGVFSRAAGARELGTFLICIFFAVIGAPASFRGIVSSSPVLFAYAAVVILCNMAVTFAAGKVFRFSIDELCIASNANAGGPTTAAAMCISMGWNDLVGPALLTGTLGYVLGNYLGIFIAGILA